MCILKTCHWIVMFMFHFVKSRLFLVFFVSHCFFCMCGNQSVNLARLMIGAEDTYQPLTTIPFKVGVKTLFKMFTITSVRENICRVSVPVCLQFLDIWGNIFGNYLLNKTNVTGAVNSNSKLKLLVRLPLVATFCHWVPRLIVYD